MFEVQEYVVVKLEWSFKSVVELLVVLIVKKVFVVEFVQDVIVCIEWYDGKVNVICVRDFDCVFDVV